MYAFEPGQLEEKRKKDIRRTWIAVMVFSALLIIPTSLSTVDYSLKVAVAVGVFLCVLVVSIAAKLESGPGEKKQEAQF